MKHFRLHLFRVYFLGIVILPFTLGCQSKLKNKQPVMASEIPPPATEELKQSNGSPSAPSNPDAGVFVPVNPEEIQGKILSHGPIAISGNAIIAAYFDSMGVDGKPTADDNGTPLQQLANIYRYDGQDWALEDRLTTPKGTATGVVLNVAIGEDLAWVNIGSTFFYFQKEGERWHFMPDVYIHGGSLYKNRMVTRFGPPDAPKGLHIYKLSDYNLTLEHSIPAPREAGSFFGGSVVAFHEDVLVASARIGSGIGPGNDIDGRVYCYRFDGTHWNLEQDLYSSDITPSSPNSFFGESIDLFDDILVIGDLKQVYVLTYQQGKWQLTTSLTPPPSDSTKKNEAEKFGAEIAVHQNYILVGAPSTSPLWRGSAYLYARQPDNSWGFHIPLDPTKTNLSERPDLTFGTHVSLSDYGAVVMSRDFSAVFWPL